jgi:hypothetical protein
MGAVISGQAGVRTAWLDLYGDGSVTLPLESTTGGWFCQSLDLGYPEPREVITNRPDTDGAVDRTTLMGPRLVAAEIKAETGAGAQIDAVAASFAKFMVPSARPVLHYVLDRPGAPERTLTLRAMASAWQVVGGVERDIQLQWKAADPIARDPIVHTAIALAGAAGGSGRTYPLIYSRSYPVGGGSSSTGAIFSPGDVAVRPLLRIYGPATGPVVTFTPSAGAVSEVAFVGAYRVDAGNFVEVDTVAKTAYLNGPGGASELAWLDWYHTVWPVLPVAPASTTFGMAAGSASGSTQAQAIWQDGYLT